MKLIQVLLVIGFMSFTAAHSFAQCEPDIAGCPDPENNGEICPDTLYPAVINQSYSETITILVPDTNMGATIHHITLVDIQNMPTGLSWQSNAPNNEFMAGEYYCVLMDGTPTVADTFYLKIIVDVYIDFLGNVIYLGQQVDSTSVYMEVINPSGIPDPQNRPLALLANRPNPFSEFTEITFISLEQCTARFEVYSMTGELVSSLPLTASKGENSFRFAVGDLVPGVYFYRLSTETYTVGSSMVIR